MQLLLLLLLFVFLLRRCGRVFLNSDKAITVEQPILFLFQSLLLFANDFISQLLRVILLIYRVVFGSGQRDCTVLFHRVLQSQRHAIDRGKATTECLLEPAQLMVLLVFIFCSAQTTAALKLVSLAHLKKLGQLSCIIDFFFCVNSCVRLYIGQLGDLGGHVHLFDVFKDRCETFPLGSVASSHQGRNNQT